MVGKMSGPMHLGLMILGLWHAQLAGQISARGSQPTHVRYDRLRPELQVALTQFGQHWEPDFGWTGGAGQYVRQLNLRHSMRGRHGVGNRPYHVECGSTGGFESEDSWEE